MNARMLICATTISPLPTAIRHMRASPERVDEVPDGLGLLGRGLAQTDRACQRRREAGAPQARAVLPASPRRPRSAAGQSAAAAPPSGNAVCRIPSANPRCDGANQPITARPLAAFTLAPAAPARTSMATSTP